MPLAKLGAAEQGWDRQHGAASADPGTWSAVIACRNGVQIDLDYGWLPLGYPQWTPPEDVCVTAG